MRRNWWFVWVEVAVLAVALFVSYKIVSAKVDGMLSPYLTGDLEVPAATEPTETTEEEANIVDKIMNKAESVIGKKINYEDLIFDYANAYAKEMMKESEQERNAVSSPLS